MKTMTTKYKHGKEVPTSILAKRLDELSDACVRRMKGDKATFEREFTFRVPAELDRDADLVLSEASKRLVEQHEENQRLEAKVAEIEQELQKSTDQNDLVLDEFIRVKCLTDNTEIHQLCERAHIRMRQNVSVIERNHRMEKRIAELEKNSRKM